MSLQSWLCVATAMHHKTAGARDSHIAAMLGEKCCSAAICTSHRVDTPEHGPECWGHHYTAPLSSFIAQFLSFSTYIFLSRCAGEESVEQIGSRAERMGLMANSNIFLYSATRMDVCPCCRHVHMSKFAMHCCRAVCVCRRCPGAVLLKGLSVTFTPTTVSRPLCAGHPAGDSGDAAGGGHHRLHPDGVPGRCQWQRRQRQPGAPLLV